MMNRVPVIPGAEAASSNSSIQNHCTECNKTFKHRRSYVVHMDKHAGKRYSCDCGKSFSSSDSLKIHKLSHSGSRPHKCSVCSASFVSKSKCKRHELIHKDKNSDPSLNHTDTKIYICTVCNKVLGSAGSLRKHQSKHQGKRYSCTMCDKSYTSNHSLKMHELKHKDEKPWECSTCGAGFMEKKLLRRHEKSHTGERSEICDVCGKTFMDKSNLQSHLKTHQDRVPVQCHICGKSVLSATSLKQHLKLHSNKRDFKCDICSRTFTQKHSLIKHLDTHRSEPVRHKSLFQPPSHFCKKCHKGFTNPIAVKRHLRKHQAGILKQYNRRENQQFKAITTASTLAKEVDEKRSLTGIKVRRDLSADDLKDAFIVYPLSLFRDDEVIADKSLQSDNSDTDIGSGDNQKFTNNLADADDKTERILSDRQDPDNENVTVNGVGGFADSGPGKDQCYKSKINGNDKESNVTSIDNIESDLVIDEGNFVSSHGEIGDAKAKASKQLYQEISDQDREVMTDEEKEINLDLPDECDVSSCKTSRTKKSNTQPKDGRVNHLEIESSKVNEKTTELSEVASTCEKKECMVRRSGFSKPAKKTTKYLVEIDDETGELKKIQIVPQKATSVEMAKYVCDTNCPANLATTDESSDLNHDENKNVANQLKINLQPKLKCIESQTSSLLPLEDRQKSRIWCGLLDEKAKPSRKDTNIEKCVRSTTNAVNPQAHDLVRKINYCENCGKSFSQTSHFNRHKRKNACKPKLKCDLCEYSSCSGSQLKMHLKSAHKQLPFECSLCDKKFGSVGGLNKHKRCHVDGTSELQQIRCHICEVCGCQFTAASSLHCHMVSHSGNRAYKCDICGNAYTQKGHLMRHKTVVHEAIKKFKCSFDGCVKSFSDSRALKVHIRTHTGEKPYKCAFCDKYFSQQQICNTHQKTHLGKQFSCPVCKKDFSTKMSVLRHMKLHKDNTREPIYKVNTTQSLKITQETTKLLPEQTCDQPLQNENYDKVFCSQDNLLVDRSQKYQPSAERTHEWNGTRVTENHISRNSYPSGHESVAPYTTEHVRAMNQTDMFETSGVEVSRAIERSLNISNDRSGAILELGKLNKDEMVNGAVDVIGNVVKIASTDKMHHGDDQDLNHDEDDGTDSDDNGADAGLADDVILSIVVTHEDKLDESESVGHYTLLENVSFH